MKLLVGLGNPGEGYQDTRHNLGFTVLDEYAKKHLGPQISWREDKKFKAEILKLSNDLWLVKPQTFMNNSGIALFSLTTYYKLSTADLVIIHDDLDLPLGKIKIRLGGAAGGHHGVESIIDTLKSDKFIRVRLGIGNLHVQRSERSRQHVDVEHFVLEEFIGNEKPKVKQMIKQSIAALELLLEKGLEAAQNQYN